MEKEQRVQPALPLWWWPPGESSASKGHRDGCSGEGCWCQVPGRRGDIQPRLARDGETCATKGKFNSPAQAGKSPAEITVGMGCAGGVPCLLGRIRSFPLLPPHALSVAVLG